MSRQETKAQRWTRLERMLVANSDGIGVRELSKRLDVHRATIYRDIEQLSEVGLPIWQDSGRVGMLIEKQLMPLKLDIYEALSLFIAARLLSRQTGEGDPHVVSLLEKLASIMPSPVSEHLRKSAKTVSARSVDQDYIRNLEILMWSWVNGRRLRMWYQSAWKDSSRERLFDVYFIEPLETVYSCYVIGLDHYYGEIRTFKIKRIRRLEVTAEKYVINPIFDIFRRWANSWGIVMAPDKPPITVKLRFSKNVAFMIKEAVWHSSQAVEDTDDGGCIFSATVDHPLGIKLWIRNWGPEVEILEPESLRQEAALDARALAALYADLDLSESAYRPGRYPL